MIASAERHQAQGRNPGSMNGAREAVRELGPDELLQHARRIDWRFLLPDPNLGQVLYIAPEPPDGQDEHRQALRLFSQELTVAPSWQAAVGQGRQYSVVVVSQPKRECLPAVASLVQPGGHLYLENRGPLAFLRERGPGITPWHCRGSDVGGPFRLVRELRELGLEDVRAHWHWPSFRACTRLIPLDGPEGLLVALGLWEGTLGERAKAALARALFRTGWIRFLMASYSVVAWRGL